MFAIFLHQSMNTFHLLATSFPTVIFTVILIVCMIFWLFSVLGLADIEILDFDTEIDANNNLDTSIGFAGILLKLGLNGVPLTIVITLIAITGWTLSYFSMYFAVKLMSIDSSVFWIIKPTVFLASLHLSIVATSIAIKPLRKLFKAVNSHEEKHILGQTVTVRSSTVTEKNGEGILIQDGADILLNIRSSNNELYKKGDQVVVIEQIGNENLYRIISISEFSN